MNINYSYRAFLIAALLVGNLVLLLLSVKLSNFDETEEEVLAVEYAQEDLFTEEEMQAQNAVQKSEISTHRAFNEDKKFISEAEAESAKISKEMEAQLTKMNDALEKTKSEQIDGAEISEKLNETLKKTTAHNLEKANKRNSTNSYRLANREAMHLPNPVYTCEGFGKIVINIEVNAIGKVTKASYNAKLSTTSNGCLIDSAISYAQQSRFNTSASKPTQIGTITYIFPGQ